MIMMLPIIIENKNKLLSIHTGQMGERHLTVKFVLGEKTEVGAGGGGRQRFDLSGFCVCSAR